MIYDYEADVVLDNLGRRDWEAMKTMHEQRFFDSGTGDEIKHILHCNTETCDLVRVEPHWRIKEVQIVECRPFTMRRVVLTEPTTPLNHGKPEP
jgi:hypothetical protein